VARAEKSRKRRKRAAHNKYKSKSRKNTGQCKRVMDLYSTLCGNKQELCQAKYDTVGETKKIEEIKTKDSIKMEEPDMSNNNFTKSKAIVSTLREGEWFFFVIH